MSNGSITKITLLSPLKGGYLFVLNYLRWKVAQFFEIRWWKNYLKKTTKEEYLHWKKQYWSEFFRKLDGVLEIEEREKILDIGCGPAGIFVIYPHNDVVAIDPLIDTYEKELACFSRSAYPNISFKASCLEDFQWQEKFNVIFCLNAINHFLDIRKAAENMVLFAEKNSHIILSVEVHRYKLLKYLFRILPFDILHPYQLGLGECVGLFTGKEGVIYLKHQELLKRKLVFDYYLLIFERRAH